MRVDEESGNDIKDILSHSLMIQREWIDVLALAGLPVSCIWMGGCVHIASVTVD